MQTSYFQLNQRFHEKIDIVLNILSKPFIIFFLLSCLVNILVFLGPYRGVYTNDVYTSFMIRLDVLSDILFKYGISKWDPTILSGNNLLAEQLQHPFHPALILNHFMPLWLVHALWSIFFNFISGHGMYLYLNRSLSLSKNATYFGSILFLGLTSTVHLDQTFVFLFPLFLYGFHQWLRNSSQTKTKSFFFFLFFCLCFISASAQFTVPYFPLMHLFEILLVSSKQQRKSYFMRFCLIWFIYTLFHAPNIYSLITEASHSHRAAIDIPGGIEFSRILRGFFGTANKYFIIDIFSSFLILPLSFLIISWCFLKNKIIQFYSIFSILLIFLIIFSQTDIGNTIFRHFGHTYYQGIHLPRLFALVYPFVYCLLVAYGMHFLEKSLKQETISEITFSFLNPQWVGRFIFPLIIALLSGASFFYHLTHLSRRVASSQLVFLSFFIPSLLLISAYLFSINFRVSNKVRLFCISFFLLFSLFSIRADFSYHLIRLHHQFIVNNDFMKMIAAQEQENKQYPFRAVMLKSVYDFYHYPTYLNYHGFYTIEGYTSIYPKRYKDLFAKILEPSYPEPVSAILDDFRAKGNKVYLLSTYPQRDHPYELEKLFYENLLALMNVKYIFSTLPIRNIEQFNHLKLYLKPPVLHHRELDVCTDQYATDIRNLFREPSFKTLHLLWSSYKNCKSYYWVYSIDDVFPRTFIVDRWHLFQNPNNLLNAMRDTPTQKSKKMAFLLKDDLTHISLPNTPENIISSVKIVEYTPDYIRIEGSSNKSSILILTDTFHPKWNAYLNKQKTAVFPANYTFRGVSIPKGNFSLEFKYEDTMLEFMYVLMYVGMAGLFLLMLYPFKKVI